MARRASAWFGVLLFLRGVCFGSPPVASDDEKEAPSAASVRMALLHPEEGMPAMTRAVPAGERSVPLAFGLSAAVPGLGQAYNRQWIKAAALIAVEAALLTGYVVYRGRGADGRDAYQATAHADWSPAQYAAWLNDYRDYLEATYPERPIDAAPVAPPQGIDFAHPERWSGETRRTVRQLFDQIRTLEDDLYHPRTGASFSHKLPYFGEQQYYELIGKYFQFMPGWSDYPAWIDEDGAFTDAIDPETPGAAGRPDFSDAFWEYAKNHAAANDYFRRASRLSAFIIANHVIAAVEAAIAAKLHNDRVSAHVGLGYSPDGQVQPQAVLRLTW